MRAPVTACWSNDLISLFLLEETDVTTNYVDWLNNPEVNRYLETRFATHTLESTRQFVRTCAENPNSLLLGIRSHSLGNRYIGNIKLEINWLHGLGEIGIMIGESDARGKGLAYQAISLLTAIARDELKLRKLTAGCYASNKASERSFIKVGFTKEGERPQHFICEGRLENLILLGIIL